MNSNPNQFQLIDLFVKKVLAHLDETNQNKLVEFLQLFQSPKTTPQATTASKIIFDSMPFADPTIFLTMWSQQVVQTQHVLSALDYHVIPTGASNTILCNVNCKVRFDESGRNKLGQDSVLENSSTMNNRPQWGSYFGVSLQICLEDRIFRNDFNGVITSLNYKIVYKPDDSLIKIM
ncbi:mRNA transport regulator MTR2 [Nakaseomyces bracarensis]|uniref:mRNA transport regulator MTR2 n=1 Tax=Nakaseomyces bracarensis TaxID=273131 RepID=A0ABR4NNI5_9SACH